MATPESELPKKNLKLFLNAISDLEYAHNKNNNILRKNINRNWYILYCKASDHYYAVQKDSASTITSGNSCIRPAYRVNPKTKQFDYEVLGDEPNTRHYKFAVKEYTKPSSSEEAHTEFSVFNSLQFAENIIIQDGKPTLISIYFAGEPLTDIRGNTTPLLNHASFIDRLTLIDQIMEQYLLLHNADGAPRLHIDVKGQNIIVNVGEGIQPQARLIDFGSVLSMTEKSIPVATTISGMTSYAIAPDAISDVDPTISYRLADVASGKVTTKSDIYNLVAVFASILGERQPYANRHCNISDLLGSFNIAAIRQSIANGFKTDGLFSFNKKLDFHLPNEEATYFFRKKTRPAPIKSTVIADANGLSGYFQYENHLLYVENDQVYGYHIKIRGLNKKIAGFQESEVLKVHDLCDLDTLSGYHRKNTGMLLQNILEQEIRVFLEAMGSVDPAKRPDTQETYCFFNTILRIANLAEYGKDPKHSDENFSADQVTKAIKLLLCQIQLINLGLGEHEIIPSSTPINAKTKFNKIVDYDFFNLIYDDQFTMHYELLNNYITKINDRLNDDKLPQPEWPSELTIALSYEVRALSFFRGESDEVKANVKETFDSWKSNKSSKKYLSALHEFSIFNSLKAAQSPGPAIAASSSSQL